MEVENRLLFPVLHPENAWDRAVVLVNFSIPFFPVKELALSDADPLNNLLGRCFSPLGPVVGVIDAPFWNVTSGEIRQHQTIQSPLWACEVSRDGRLLVTFGETSPQTNLRIYALPDPKPVSQLSELADQRSAITLSADGRSLAACNVDEMLFTDLDQGLPRCVTSVMINLMCLIGAWVLASCQLNSSHSDINDSWHYCSQS